MKTCFFQCIGAYEVLLYENEIVSHEITSKIKFFDLGKTIRYVVILCIEKMKKSYRFKCFIRIDNDYDS